MSDIYIVIAYRWNDSNNHSYLVGAHHNLDKAKELAEKEADCRGGKYSVRVYKCSTCCEWSEDLDSWKLVHTAMGQTLNSHQSP